MDSDHYWPYYCIVFTERIISDTGYTRGVLPPRPSARALWDCGVEIPDLPSISGLSPYNDRETAETDFMPTAGQIMNGLKDER
jgi:hypothetical protein